MGRIFLTVEGTTVGTVAQGRGIVVEKSVSEQDSGRLIAAFAQIHADKFTDEEGNPRKPSIQDVIQAWFDDIIDQSAHRVKVQEQKNAMAAAAAGVPSISIVHK